MKDKSLLFFTSIFGIFTVFGSILFFRASPETLPERTKIALQTAGFRGISAAFIGEKAYLLGEAPSDNDLLQAAKVVERVRGVGPVDISHATVKPRLASPHMSLAFVGNQLSARGQVSGQDTKDEILANLAELFPEAEIDSNRLVIREDVENYGGFGEAPRTLGGVGEMERERGVVAAVGGDVVWQVMTSGSGIDEIRTGLAKVLPMSEVEETLDEFDDVLTTEHLRDDNIELRTSLDESGKALESKKGEVNSLKLVVEDLRVEMGEVVARAQAAEMALSMTRGELSKRESELGEVRVELMAKVKEAAEAATSITGLESRLESMAVRLGKKEEVLETSLQREKTTLAELDKLKSGMLGMEAEVSQLGGELERLKGEKLSVEKEMAARITEVEAELETAKAEILSKDKEMEASAAQSAIDAIAREKQWESVKGDMEAQVEKLQSEVDKLQSNLAEAEARAADMEAKLRTLPMARPTPDSVIKSRTPNTSRDKELEAVRSAAAGAADRAKENADNSIDRANSLKRKLGEANSDGDSEPKEADPSGKPTPNPKVGGADKLEAIAGFSAKNAGVLLENSEPQSDNMASEPQGDDAVIEMLRSENQALRKTLERLIDLDEPKPEDSRMSDQPKAEFRSGDPFEDSFAELERRIERASESGYFGKEQAGLNSQGESENTQLSLAYEEIARLQNRIADLEAELAQSLVELSKAISEIDALKRRVVNGQATNTPGGTGNVVVINRPLKLLAQNKSHFQRDHAIDNRLRSILAYP